MPVSVGRLSLAGGAHVIQLLTQLDPALICSMPDLEEEVLAALTQAAAQFVARIRCH